MGIWICRIYKDGDRVMLYKDYVERKTANAIRVNSAEGYPCVFDNSKGRPLKDYKIYGNSTQDGTPTPDNPIEIQSVGDLTKNLFDMNKLIEQGWVQQVDGSYYVKKSSTPYQQVLWENAENYTGQLKILFKVKYSLDNKPGCYLWVNYTDGTHLNVSYQDGTIVADTWYSPTISRTITDTNKTVKNVTWVYGTTINSTWVKDIIITKDIAVTEYEPYHKYDIPIVVRGKNLIKYPYVTASRTMNGVKYTVNKDGSVTVVGTATAASYFILNGNVDFGNSSIPENSTNGVYATSEGVKYNVSNHTVSINVASGETVDKIVYPQIEYGTTATEYEPYQGSETIHIYLDKPLCKVGNYADYIDFKHQKVVRNIFKHSLNTGFSIYRKLNNVIRFVADGPFGKCDYHIRSTIFGNYSGFSNDKETVFHHPTSMYAFYWSVYWHRLGLTYDGTNVYRTDDAEQTPLTDSEIVNIAKEWLNTLSDKDREVYIILGVPTEKSTTLSALKTFKGTNIISVDTNISPSNIQVQYIER